MQHFRMVYHTSHLHFLSVHTTLGECYTVKKIQVTCGLFHGIPTSEHCITILYHALENTMANTVNATYARHMMGKLVVIPLNI